MFSRWSEHYAELWKAIIRPPRDNYQVEDLGPTVFTIGDYNYQRTDINLKGSRGLTLKCSHFEPVQEERPAEKLPCVIYLHGNCSSRLEALTSLSVLLPNHITVFAFDFSGSGQSEGEYISLGYWERDDVAAVVSYLRESNRTTCIGLWGRSMGAVTALLHGDRDPSIGGMVLDSPFASLRLLAEELCDTYVKWKMPKWLIGTAMAFIRMTISSKAAFDIDKLTPINHVDKTFIPALFIAGEGDQFIQPHHTKDLHDRYSGDKNMVICEGDHNSARPQFLNNSIMFFFHTTLQCSMIPSRDRRGGRSPAQNLTETQGVDMSRLLAAGAVSGVSPKRAQTQPSPPRDRPPHRHEMQPPQQTFHFERDNAGHSILTPDFAVDDEEECALIQQAIRMSLAEAERSGRRPSSSDSTHNHTNTNTDTTSSSAPAPAPSGPSKAPPPSNMSVGEDFPAPSPATTAHAHRPAQSENDNTDTPTQWRRGGSEGGVGVNVTDGAHTQPACNGVGERGMGRQQHPGAAAEDASPSVSVPNDSPVNFGQKT
ncbi:unnamed protein product [Vitrella brassicaformis CCMP3155]|uniref:Serine aminopeptidase S33 domain-containing protein n=2 Tax=Vitrella brassicaformis TaxID=1169539 RepID=A0A0G4EM15_VITBC|nr:unnamed protein product [Vitrella brassicaformis CCMP3155]|mmetsp:Transcript_35562/g.88410  ORF Transcript_35562/g.88410 Transcript_35562/m.88410 type:complete len:540 (+) Transcript_35562:228-1847(+)|eukprot:CEL97883.1 unnamed protein product [Vitrella brassicaformis CCMP3155]